MREKGFTLIEISIVIVVIGIISGILFFFWNGGENRSLEDSARMLAGDLLWARLSAINDGIYYMVEFWPGDKDKDWEYRIKRGSDFSILKKGVFQRRVHIVNINFPSGGGNLLFYPNGSPSSGVTVTLKSKKGDMMYVKVEAVVGRIRVTDIDD